LTYSIPYLSTNLQEVGAATFVEQHPADEDPTSTLDTRHSSPFERFLDSLESIWLRAL
jgi:hypothetical protein